MARCCVFRARRNRCVAVGGLPALWRGQECWRASWRRQAGQGALAPATRASETPPERRVSAGRLTMFRPRVPLGHSPAPGQHVTHCPRRVESPAQAHPTHPVAAAARWMEGLACLGPSRASTAPAPSERCELCLGALTALRADVFADAQRPRARTCPYRSQSAAGMWLSRPSMGRDTLTLPNHERSPRQGKQGPVAEAYRHVAGNG